MELRLEGWRECTEKNDALKLSRAEIEKLQTKGDSDPVRMERYMETEIVNLPTVQSFKYLGLAAKTWRAKRQRHGRNGEN